MASVKFLLTFTRTSAGSVSPGDAWVPGGAVEVWQGRVPVIHDMKTLRTYTDGDETLEKANVMAFLPARGFALLKIGDVASWQEGSQYKQGKVLGLSGTARIALIEARDVNDPLSLGLAFITNPVRIAVADEVYSYTALATNPGGSTPVVSVISIPSWMTATPITGGLLLEGTPTTGDVGTGTVQIQADADAVTKYQSFTVAVYLAAGVPAHTHAVTDLEGAVPYGIIQGNEAGDAWQVRQDLKLINADHPSEQGMLAAERLLDILPVTSLSATETLLFLAAQNGSNPLWFLAIGDLMGSDPLSFGPLGEGALFSIAANGEATFAGAVLGLNTQPMDEAEAIAGVDDTQRTISAEVLKAAAEEHGGGGAGAEPGGVEGSVQVNVGDAFEGNATVLADLVNAILQVVLDDAPPKLVIRRNAVSGDDIVGDMEWRSDTHPDNVAGRIRLINTNAAGNRSKMEIHLADGSDQSVVLAFDYEGFFGFSQTSPAARISLGSDADALPTDDNGESLHADGFLVAKTQSNAYLAAVINSQNKGNGIYIRAGNTGPGVPLRIERTNGDLVLVVYSDERLGVGKEPDVAAGLDVAQTIRSDTGFNINGSDGFTGTIGPAETAIVEGGIITGKS